jgi:Holliday junction DNA helicase RuvA
MFDYIKGELTDTGDGFVVVENGGIGYRIAASTATVTLVAQTPNCVKLFTYLNVRDDGLFLFGFATKEEKNMFLRLITISGVGPKAALSILSGIELNKLMVAIINQDVKTLTKIKGIGKKTAERIVLELKESLDASAAEAAIEAEQNADADIRDKDSADAVYALRGLGFTQNEAERAVKKAKPDAHNLQELIAFSLRSLN